MVKDRKDWSKRITNNKLNFSKPFNGDVAVSMHTYIQTLLKLPKWVFQLNTIKNLQI